MFTFGFYRQMDKEIYTYYMQIIFGQKRAIVVGNIFFNVPHQGLSWDFETASANY